MSQRVAASAGSSAGGGSTQESEPVQHYSQVNPLMPESLRMVPPWYEGGTFRHTTRMLVGVVPGAVLLITVTGTTMLTAVLGGALLTLLVRYLGHSWVSMMLTVCHVVFLEVVNVYCMGPLIWRSVLNLPLYGMFHLFIAITGILWWLQEEEFQRQEPRFVIMLERICFYLYPAISVTMVTWICGILFGRAVLPFVILIAGVAAFSLYLVPLQSSFAKPNTPAGVGLIQHRFVVWLYTVLLMTVPPIAFTAIMHHYTLQSFMLLALLVMSTPFLLTLLEAQGLGHWFGLSPKIVQSVRMITGVVVLVLFSACVSLAQPASLLPLLLLPILLLTMALFSFAEHAPSALPTLAMGGALALLYTAAFAELPWSITHTSSFLALPLSVLQLLVWVVALGGVAVMTFWSRVTPQLLAIYNGVFILCEYILTWDEVYPLSVSMATGVVAALTFWRLCVVGKLPLSTCLFSMCLHVTKLSLLFPCAHSPSPLTSSLLPFCSTLLTSYLILRLFLFDHTPSLGSGQLLTYSGLLFVGLLLSVDTILSPIWASLTHSLPSSASLLATVLGAVALYVNHGLSLMGSHDSPPLISSLPPSLGVMAALLWLLQPEFSVPELIGSFVVTVGDKAAYPDFIYVAAWKNLLTWVTLFSTVFVLLQLLSPTRIAVFTVASTALLGVLAGFLAALSLLQVTPGTIGSLLYASILGVGGALCGRVHSAQKQGNWIDKIIFFVLFVLFLTTYCVEFVTLPHFYIPGKPRLDDYGKPCTLVISMCSLIVAVVFRIKMHLRREEPYLPVMANIACCVFFITAILQQFHPQPEIAILISSLVFLLTQPDGVLRPKKDYVFVAPCLMWSILFLYAIALTTIFPLFRQQFPTYFIAARVAEVTCLVLAVPGHLLFLYYLWTGDPPTLSLRFMLLYVLPHCLLPQLASSMASSILGSVGIFSFSLILISSHTLTGPKSAS